MAKVLKQLLSSQLKRLLEGSAGVVLVDLGPMSVEKSGELRSRLKANAGGARLRIVHNRTARVAFKEAGYPEAISKVLRGPTAVVHGGESASSIAKCLVDWTKTDKALVLKGAVSEGEFYDAKGVVALSRLPDKATLRAMLLGALQGPARGIAAVIAAGPGGLARAVQARADAGGFPA